MRESADLSWIERHPLAAAVLWASIPSTLALVFAPNFEDPELRKVFYAGGATLLFGGFLGGALKLILDEVAVAKRRRDDAAAFVTNVLADLKKVYDRTATSQLLISAHKSAKTYGDELRGLIEATVQLRNVKRALTGRADGVNKLRSLSVAAEVDKMSRYLEELTIEFRDNYKDLSDRQRSYEAKSEAMVKEFASSSSESTPPVLPTFVWQSITQLPRLQDFIVNGNSYRIGFEEPLDKASGLLRQELAQILRRSRSLTGNADS